MDNTLKIVIEKHSDCYCGYLWGFTNGAIIGQGNTYSEALLNTQDSIKAYIEYVGFDEFNQHFFADN